MNRIIAPRWLTAVKRLAAFGLACSFFLPLYSCSTRHQAQVAKSIPALATVALSAPAPASAAPTVRAMSPRPLPPQLPARLEFSAYEAFSWGDPYSHGALVAIRIAPGI